MKPKAIQRGWNITAGDPYNSTGAGRHRAVGLYEPPHTYLADGGLMAVLAAPAPAPAPAADILLRLLRQKNAN